jgi:hypothetical protein
MDNLKCLECIGNFLILSDEEREEILTSPNEFDNRVKDAVTLVPSWQQNMPVPGQLVVACTAVPSCMDHIKVAKPSPQQIASRSGLVVPNPN